MSAHPLLIWDTFLLRTSSPGSVDRCRTSQIWQTYVNCSGLLATGVLNGDAKCTDDQEGNWTSATRFTRIFDDMASGTWHDISSKSENIPHRTIFFTTNHSVSSDWENSILHKALTSDAVRIKLPTKSLKVVGFSICVHVGHSARWGLSI